MNSIFENDDYDLVLENVPKNEFLLNYLKSYCRQKKQDTYIVSLSGGVDSMVIASILKYLKKNVVCIHINYNNRKESNSEALFLKSWSEKNGIVFHIYAFVDFSRESTNRKLYETMTRKVRFDFYNELLNQYKDCSIILGHHDDDIIENVFNNVCRGRSLLDLKVMHKESFVSNVPISRPLLGIRKKEVYKFAEEYKIPYFKDTTPLWSLRGNYRKVFSPLLEETYSGFSENMIAVGEQSDQWSAIIKKNIIDPFMEKLVYDEKTIFLPLGEHTKSPEVFWKTILTYIYKKYNKNIPSNKSVKNFIKYLSTPSKLILSKESHAIIGENNVLICFY